MKVRLVSIVGAFLFSICSPAAVMKWDKELLKKYKASKTIYEFNGCLDSKIYWDGLCNDLKKENLEKSLLPELAVEEIDTIHLHKGLLSVRVQAVQIYLYKVNGKDLNVVDLNTLQDLKAAIRAALPKKKYSWWQFLFEPKEVKAQSENMDRVVDEMVFSIASILKNMQYEASCQNAIDFYNQCGDSWNQFLQAGSADFDEAVKQTNKNSASNVKKSSEYSINTVRTQLENMQFMIGYLEKVPAGEQFSKAVSTCKGSQLATLQMARARCERFLELNKTEFTSMTSELLYQFVNNYNKYLTAIGQSSKTLEQIPRHKPPRPTPAGDATK